MNFLLIEYEIIPVEFCGLQHFIGEFGEARGLLLDQCGQFFFEGIEMGDFQKG